MPNLVHRIECACSPQNVVIKSNTAQQLTLDLPLFARRPAPSARLEHSVKPDQHRVHIALAGGQLGGAAHERAVHRHHNVAEQVRAHNDDRVNHLELGRSSGVEWKTARQRDGIIS